METETVGILGLFVLLFVVGLVLSLVFHFARKPFERLVDRVIPGDDLAVTISRQMRIDVDPDKNAWDPERFSVDLGATNPAEGSVGKERNARAAARGIELAKKHERASTEDLTQAMDHYRTLFDELLLPA